MAVAAAVRVGIDLVEVTSVRQSLRTHAQRYLDRIYTEAEVADCRTTAGVRAEGLAARFAAKEAVLKVLRPGDEGVAWRAIEVVREPAGWTSLRLSGRAAELAEQARITELAVSLSHEGPLATAVVVAMLDQEAE
ncbi:MAG: holo-ACP synthase [Gaiellaceae bacterium]